MLTSERIIIESDGDLVSFSYNPTSSSNEWRINFVFFTRWQDSLKTRHRTSKIGCTLAELRHC